MYFCIRFLFLHWCARVLAHRGPGVSKVRGIIAAPDGRRNRVRTALNGRGPSVRGFRRRSWYPLVGRPAARSLRTAPRGLRGGSRPKRPTSPISTPPSACWRATRIDPTSERALRRRLPAQPALRSLRDGRRRRVGATSGGRGSPRHQAIGAVWSLRRRHRRARASRRRGAGAAERRRVADEIVEHLATSARNKGCTRVEVSEPLASAEPSLWKRLGFASRGRTLGRTIG